MSYPVGHKGNDLERIMAKVLPVTESGCWIWEGAAGRYGKTFTFGRYMDVHRAMWLLTFGEIPDGMRVCHRCDVTLCVNPSHLFLGTAKENTRDMMAKGRHRFGTHNAPRGDNHWQRRKQVNGI